MILEVFPPAYLNYDKFSDGLVDKAGNTVSLHYDSSKDLWIHENGAEYVQNTCHERNPIWIRVDTLRWEAFYQGNTISFDWPSFKLPSEFLVDFRECQKERLRRYTPLEINRVKYLLRQITSTASNISISGCVGSLSDSQLSALVSGVNKHSASLFRSLYRTMVAIGRPGCTQSKLSGLEQIRIFGESIELRRVRTWDPTHGALTTAEYEVLRIATAHVAPDESDTLHFGRVSLRLALILGRRSAQMTSIKKGDIRPSSRTGSLSPIAVVPGAKKQRNDKPRHYDIPQDLYDDLASYSKRPAVKQAQEATGLFFVLPKSSRGVPRRISSSNFLDLMKSWVNDQALISPRTGELLHITTLRIRHTVATQLVRRGWSKEDISEFLEHESDTSVLAYIDAVGSDFAPEFERLNVKLGGIFSELSHSFAGKKIPRPSGSISKPIIVPGTLNRSIIGQCGMSGRCSKSPFVACLNGCPSFHLFSDVDLDDARKWVSGESEKWRSAGRSSERSAPLIDFHRLAKSIDDASRQNEET